jgi:ornithine decarboxylase
MSSTPSAETAPLERAFGANTVATTAPAAASVWTRPPSAADEGRLQALAATHGTPLLALDCDELRARYRALCRTLPGVVHHYAVKAFPDATVIRTLDAEGAHFDAATAGELELLRGAGVAAERCIHTHPIKRERDIAAAIALGCHTFVVDNHEELTKLLAYRDRVRLLVRLGFRNPDAVVDLARKFGCDAAEARRIFEEADALGLDVAGVSFHVGSQTPDGQSHVEAIHASARLMAACGPQLRVLADIETFCRPIREALATLPAQVEIISEPGRYLVASAVTTVTSVMGRAQRGDRIWYYLDDGIYGSFSGQLYDKARYPLEALGRSGELRPCVLAGPTCDGLDVVDEAAMMPELEPGDLVAGRMMGAYTAASATGFNHFPRAAVVPFNE